MIIPPDERAITLNDTNTAATDTEVVITIATETDGARVIDEVFVSFDKAFAAGKQFKIEFGGTVKFDVDLLAAGLHPFRWRNGLMTGIKNEAVVLTMAADTGGAIATINVNYR